MNIHLSQRQRSVLGFFSLFSFPPQKNRFDLFWGSDSQEILDAYFGREEVTKNTSSEYLKKGEKWAMRLKNIPFVRAVSIVNTVSFGLAKKESDIDFLVVVQEERMWTARLFVTAFLFFGGVKRRSKKIAGKVCLSFFVDESEFSFFKIKREKDPYLAFWIAGMIPVFGNSFFTKVKNENEEWVKKEVGIPILFSPPQKDTPPWKSILEFFFPHFLERWIRKFWKNRTLQKAASLPDPSGTIVSDTILKFHDCDKRQEIQKMMSSTIPTREKFLRD